MSDILENEEPDKDTLPADEIDKIFNKHYSLLAETAVTLKKVYITKLSVTKSLNIAVGLDNNNIEVFKVNNSSLSQICRLSGHSKTLTELVFSPNEDYLLYSMGHDEIKLWDTRTSGMCVQTYKDENDTPFRPYDAMDVSCTGRVLCAGSQLVQEDAYLVFWDKRSSEPLGGYWNSHTDDITQVKFHKNKPEILATGSIDGLLNVFNILEPTEDDALTYSLNIENSVEKISWLNENKVGVITQSNDLQIWDISSGDMMKRYPRDKIARSIKRLRDDDCYLVDAYTSSEDKTVVLAGSYGGDGQVLRSVTESGKKLQPTTNFTKNKQIVRCSAYLDKNDLLITGGESGLISVWNAEEQDSDTENDVSKKIKSSLKLQDVRHKPY